MVTENNSDLAMVELKEWERPAMVRLDAADAEALQGIVDDGARRTGMLSS